MLCTGGACSGSAANDKAAYPSVIAEGVETQDQMSFLKALYCNEIQGYLVSKPLPAPYFEAFLKEHSENSIF